MFILSLTIIYIYYNNNYETETQNKKYIIDMFIISLSILNIHIFKKK